MKAAVEHFVLVQVSHPSGNISSKRQSVDKSVHFIPILCPEVPSWRIQRSFPQCHKTYLPKTPVDGDVLIQQHICQASLWTVLCDNAHERNFSAASNELGDVWVIKLPGKKKNDIYN